MGGHVAKKLGDGLMALFGYPVAQENDAERAARAALPISGRSPRSTAGMPAPASRSSMPGSGLEAGPVAVDAAGEIFGDAPNVAARVQAPPSPARFWSPRSCSANSPGLFVAEERGAHELEGVPEPERCSSWCAPVAAARRSGARQLTPLIGPDEEMAMLMALEAKSKHKPLAHLRKWQNFRALESHLHCHPHRHRATADAAQLDPARGSAHRNVCRRAHHDRRPRGAWDWSPPAASTR